MKKSEPYTDEQLLNVANHIIYHVRMYVETLLWLRDNRETSQGWNTIGNAVLEIHLVHARALINFVSYIKRKNPTDVIAVDFFQDISNNFQPGQNDFLSEQAIKIGGQLVHLTTRSTQLKSEQEWEIGEIADKLVPYLKTFLNKVPKTRFPPNVSRECLEFLGMLSAKYKPLPSPLHPST